MNSAQLRTLAERTVHGIVETSPVNTLKGFDERSWDSSIIGFAAGDDPLFASYKKLIGPFYWTPAEIMQLAYPGETFSEHQLSVICWILPQTERTLVDQRKADKLPASRWVHSRHYGEKFNEYLRATVRDTFRASGIKAAAPAITEGFGYRESKKFGLASNWSERHTAFVAGLGTFGLSDGFITERGKAVRIGSVIINAKIKPDTRKNTSHTANCLWYAKGTCGACIKRCPVDAITAKGHDKKACFDYIRGVTAPYAKEILGAYETPCGLCQVKIPCERRNPVSG
ncbi:4Fe-4S ferredoxin [uncultured Desulfuromusa sp.]|uniref:4Fe-4S ferredoxin n=1 Tax=uncultured Desulfuromusa sp. TaxID=219183 RepID=UPI002AA87844|nr:4Fe-4S ferredoxin [uncultured Desulfuromusa sp.]